MTFFQKINELFSPRTGSLLDTLSSRASIANEHRASIRKRIWVFFLIALLVAIFIIAKTTFEKYEKAKKQQEYVRQQDIPRVELNADNFLLWQSQKDYQIGQLEVGIETMKKDMTEVIQAGIGNLRQDLNSTLTEVKSSADASLSSLRGELQNTREEISARLSHSSDELKSYVDTRIQEIEDTRISIPPMPAPTANGENPENSNVSVAGLFSASASRPQEKFEVVESDVAIISDKTLTTPKPKPKKEEHIRFDIPMGFAQATIVTGVNAQVFNFGGKEAQPIYLSIDSEIALANNYTLNSKECLLLGSVTGDFGDSRGRVRIRKISCIYEAPDGRHFKAEGPLKGWVFGEEGSFGVKGRLVTKEGKIIATALPLALLETAMAYFTRPEATIYTGNGSSTTATPMVGYANQGMGDAGSAVLKKLGDIYVKYLDSLNPIVSILPGRTVTVAFEGTSASGEGGEQGSSNNNSGEQGGGSLVLKPYTPLDVDFFDKENKSLLGHASHNFLMPGDLYE